MKTKFTFKRALTLVLAVMMLVTAMPVGVFAEPVKPADYNNLPNDKAKIVNNEVPVKPAKLENGQTAEQLIENPKQPAIYTLRTDYKVQRVEKYQVDYQPYIASVGEAAIQTEKNKVNKPIDLPDIAGYKKPQKDFTIDYKTIKDAADGKNETGNDDNGLRYSANKEFNYSAISNEIKIKHVFQKLDDFTKYTNPDGSTDEEHALITTQNGNTGSTMQASPLSEGHPNRKGFIPEADYINMQVPENAKDFILEYRYNRVHYDVVFDTQGGTALPTRTLYYGQAMPKIADADIPTKVGGEFQGWKPSVDIKDKNGKTYKANEIIKVGTGSAIKNLDANLIMPAIKVIFTAVWKDKEKADYAVQFWAEKADHADGASLADKYDYIGTRVYKDKDTGMRPDLDNEPVKDIVFPDLDQARLNKIWGGARFNRGHDLYLNKFYVYNQDLTHEQNKDPANVNLVKSVDSTGKTVYNIYYDRQVYDLYFTKSNAQPEKNTFYPEIWGYDEAKGEVVKKGGPGNPYHYKARFNQLMLGWPNDAMQTKGFSKGMQSFGWGPNYTKANWPGYLDTPPYRLNADEFLDMKNYDTWGGYTKPIDKGDGTNINVDKFDFTTLSFGINQAEGSMPHHMDFWMDGFKNGETIIRYDLYRFKADTNSESYAPKYPKVQGFTGKRANERPDYFDSDGIDEKNDERADVTPFPAKTYTDMYGERPVGMMKFIKAFLNNGDEWGDPDGWDGFDKNGYLKFEYSRNKYPLRFNYDPSKIKGDNEFNSTNQLDTFYEFPLKCLSPDVDTDEEYKKVAKGENPSNLLDNPENLQKLSLTDLVFNDKNDNNKLKVKRPDNLSDQMVFKGWALDPAGSKLIWENPGEKMPSHPVNLYAKWGEPDYKWKVTFDPDGGVLENINEEKLTQERKTIQEGDIGQIEVNTYAKKEANDGDKQVFTVIQRQKLVEPAKPTKKGYDFMGWEIIHYKKNQKGDYTDEIDNSYRETYKVPELYSFGNDVVAPVYLKAIWVPNDRVDVDVDVDVIHHIMSLDLSKEIKTIPETLHNKRTGYLVAASGDKQNEKYILANHEELEQKLPDDLKALYKEYNDRVKANNTYFQTFKVEPEKIPDPNDSSKMIENPKFKDNVFHFFYRPFRTRDYKVNYIDERGKAEVEKFFKGLNLTDTSGLKDDALLKANEENNKKFEDKRTDFEKLIKKHQVIDPEAVSNGNRHYDARNYRPIPGWVLADNKKAQQQLVFDVNEKTNEFLGINGTGADQVFFYYKDVRVIEVPGDKEPPKGYVRVTFKADKGGSFGKDAEGKDITELHYDVIEGLQSQLLPVPKELEEGKEKEEGKYYITPETGKKFIKWDKSPLLNDNTIIKRDYTFTAYFEWSGLSASGLVRTEAFKDSNGKWTNDFAPKIEDLKKQLVWMEKGKEKPLPAGAVIKLYDEAGNELTSDDQVYDLVKEMGKADKDELVRTVNVKAKVTFTDGKDPQELTIPITVYKNVYEALNKAGDKPLFLKEAEAKEAKDGGLKDVTGNYVKVTVQPTNKPSNKDAKIYYVNPKAWVEISKVDISKDASNLGFTKWTADKDAQNENGEFDFTKRHKFTDKETVITPGFTNDVVEQTDPNKKPDVPDDYVKVIVKTTDKATNEFTKTFWVNPSKEVTIPVANPIGKTVDKTATEEAKAYTFKDWKSNEETSRTWANGIKGQFTKETTITAEYTDVQNIIPYDPSATDPITRPEGYVRVTFAVDPGLKLTEQKAYYVKKNSGVTLKKLEKPKYTVETGYEFTNWDKEDTLEIKDDDILVTAKAKVLADFDTVTHPGYVKVTFKAGPNGVIKDSSGNTIGEKVYYVNPNKYVNLPAPTPDGNTGYDFAAWSSDKVAGDFSLANFVNYTEDTVITAKFNQKDAVYPKLKGSTKPAGYVEVTFKVTGTDGKIADNEITTYYVDPSRQVSLKAPKTVAGTGYVFDKWRLGTNPTDQIIKPADQRQYTTNTTIYGSFTKLKDIIPATNDDGTPNLQPIDYVAVLFIGGDHANKLDGQILYYVNPKANPAQTIGKLTKPKVTSDTGWKQKADPDAWDVQDSTEIKDYTFVVAQYDPIADVVPALEDDGTSNKKPDGYVTVTFKSGANGTLQGGEKTYFVNPAKYVNLTPPTPVPDSGSYEFSTWESNGEDFILANNINYTKDTIITAKFNTKGDVIPKTKPDDSEKPQGFVKVTFVIDPTEAGKIEDGQTTTYFVRPKTDVTIQPPKTTVNTGYEFEKWNLDTTEVKQYATDTTVKGEFTKLDDIIPSKNPDGTLNAKPEGYVIVNFLKGDHGVLDGRTTFYVNPKAGKKLKDLDTKGIIVVPSPTYKFDKWDKPMDTPITGPDNINVTAEYSQLPNIIKAGPKDTAPAGYVVIIFETDGRGTITGNPAYEKTPPAGKENEIVYFVNPKKGIKLAKLADGVTPAADQLAIPSTTPNDSDKYIFDQWRAGIDTETPIIRGRVHIAIFKSKKVTMTYEAKDKTSGTVPAKLSYDIGTDITLAGGNDLKKDNYVLTGWKIGETTYKPGAIYKIKKDTIATAVWDTDYHNVDFNTDGGTYIEPKKIKHNETIGSVTPPTKDGYTFTGWQVDGKAFDPTKSKVEKDITLVAQYVPNVVEQEDPNKKPEVPKDFVKVIVKTTENDIEKATKTTKFERTFWVNPTKEVTIPVNPPTGDVVKDASGNGVTDAAGNAIVWEFKEWKSKEAAPRTWKDTIEDEFVEETTIEAKYEKTIPEPTVEASLVETYVGRKPELDDYKGALKASLGNAGIDFDTNVKSITVITEPKVDQAGMSEAKVKVEFKNGQVKEVAVPVKVDSNIYPGDSNGDKTSDTPKDYVKVTVNPKTYEEYGQQIKVYYVNPKVKVTIPELAIKDSDKEKYGFKKWTTDNNTINLLNPEEVYDFTKEYQFKDATEIYAYFEKNGEPEIQIDFNTKEIVKNIGDTVSVQEYKNAIVIPKDADGKDIVEVKGINILEDANTSEAGYTTAKIQVVYDDGKTEELIVLVKVLPDYVEQKEGEDKPDVPNDFVKVIVKTKEKVDMNGVVTEEERATNETAFERTFWVNPTKHITIDVTNPTGIKDITDNRTWNFDYWKVDTDDGAEYRTIITDQFTKDTTILAKYTKDEVQKPSVKDIITEEGVQPNKKDYLDKLEAPDGKSINDIKIIKEPNVSRPGISTATIEVEYDDGTKALVDVKVFVQRKNELRPSEPQIIYRDRIVEKEKIVEKIVKIKDNERLKELRYMQGFNGKFRPYDGLRRSEAAQILANALKADGYAYDPFYPISYTDIGDSWYTEAVRIVSQAGVFQGYSDGTFKPEGKITRAEWVATLRRFQDLKKVSGNDMGLSMGHWATEEIEAAYQAGWLGVYQDGIAHFDADKPITRQEVAYVSNKAFDRVLDKAYLKRNVNNMIHYKDINPSMPLYEDILCASNTLLTDGRYYKANVIDMDTLTFNIITDDLLIYQKKFQFFTER